MRMRISPSKCACAVTNFFTMRMRISPSHGCGRVHTRTRSHSSWLKLKVLVTKGVLGFARGLTSSDALICCQILVLILMVDETDPARDLIRIWWRNRNWWWWWWSSSEVFYLYSSTVTNYLRCACLAVSPHHHNNPTFCSNCCWICFSLANGIIGSAEALPILCVRYIRWEREREREIQREREREREKDGSDVTVVALKLAMSFALLLAKKGEPQ